MARLKADGVDQELLFHRSKGIVKKANLTPVVVKGVRTLPDEVPAGRPTWGGEEATTDSLVGLRREAIVQCVWAVMINVFVNKCLTITVAVVVMRVHIPRSVDGDLLKVGTTVAVELCVEIREE